MANYTSPGGQFPEEPWPEPYRPPPEAPSGTNTMAVLAIVLAFIVAPLGILFGAIGRSQTRRTGQAGRGLATAGMILGIVFTVLGVVSVALIVVAVDSVTHTVAQSDVESQIGDGIQRTSGSRPQSVSCPGNLASEVGASIRCTVRETSKSYTVVATVSSVDGHTANFTTRVEQLQPTGSGPPPAAPPATVDNTAVRGQLEAVTNTLTKVETDWDTSSTKDEKAGNVPAAQADAAVLRQNIFDYDAFIRKTTFPQTVSTEVADVLGADKVVIADLDAVGAASTTDEYNRVINAVIPDYKALASAVDALESALH